MSNITDKVVVITGASSGMGKAPLSFSQNEEQKLC